MRKPTRDYNLLKLNPKLARQWHPTRNGNLTPQGVTPGSSRDVWWKCSRGHEWKTRVATRSLGSGCPYCTGRRKPDTGKWRLHSRGMQDKSGQAAAMHKVGETSAGNVLVEMSRHQWESFCGVTPPPEDLGAAIVQYRKKRGLSQGAFAEMVGHSRNWISAIERDRNIRLAYETYKRIMAVITG
ncbi:MAG: zinc-ribbon domain-containing protein [Thermodesulfobacteriota bacterium]